MLTYITEYTAFIIAGTIVLGIATVLAKAIQLCQDYKRK